MKRRNFIALTGASIFVIAGELYYLSTDKSNFIRTDINDHSSRKSDVNDDERAILYLASLAPSGHNTQPWLVKYLEPYHWIIGNDKSRWLPAVDPKQRETILSIGAFLQNLEYAANNLGYNCEFNILAKTNQDENIVDVKLTKANGIFIYEVEKIKNRRTVRSNYLNEILSKEDIAYLINDEKDFIHFIPNASKEHLWLNEQTIEANRIQAYREAAQSELANWIRFSSKDAAKHLDGLTLASMEIEGIPAWLLRNFYSKENVLKKSFKEQSIDKVVDQVSQSAGWLVITSKDNSVESLLETGKRLQRIWLKVRDKNIAIHPMTQIIEEAAFNKILNSSIGIKDPIQFILRTGYLKNYPIPVTLRRSIDQFIQT